MSVIVRSQAFEPGAAIPRRHSGDGEDLSPPLSWTGIPPGTSRARPDRGRPRRPHARSPGSTG